MDEKRTCLCKTTVNHNPTCNVKLFLLGRTRNCSIEGVFGGLKTEGENTFCLLGIDWWTVSLLLSRKGMFRWALYLPVALEQTQEYLFTHIYEYLLMFGNIYYYSWICIFLYIYIWIFINIYEYLLTYMNIGIFSANRSLLLLLSVMTHISTLWLVHCSLAILSSPSVASINCTIDESGLWMLLNTTRPSAELIRNQAQWHPALWSLKSSWSTRRFILCRISVALMQQRLPHIYKAISVLFVLIQKHVCVSFSNSYMVSFSFKKHSSKNILAKNTSLE